VISSYPEVEDSIMNGENMQMYTWKKWDIPMSEERLKQSYFILQDYFKQID